MKSDFVDVVGVVVVKYVGIDETMQVVSFGRDAQPFKALLACDTANCVAEASKSLHLSLVI